MSTDAARRIAALRRSHDDLVRFVDDFDERLLETGSGAADWTVAQVLGHLGSGAEIGYGTLRAALEGGPAPDRETLVPIWDALERAAAPGRARRLPPVGRAPRGRVRGPRRGDARGPAHRPRLPSRAHRRGHDGDVPAERARAPQLGRARRLRPRRGARAVHGAVPDRAHRPGWRPGPPDRPAARGGSASRPPSRSSTCSSSSGTASASVRTRTPQARPAPRCGSPPRRWCAWPPVGWGPAHTPDTVAIEGDLTLDDLRAVFPGY